MRVPFIPQQQAEECGPACLAMILAAHGHHAPLNEVRDLCGVGRSGVTAYDIHEAAASYGLSMKGYGSIEPDELPAYMGDGPVILHWGLDHWVVCDGTTRGHLEIIDPARGRMTIPMSQAFTSDEGMSGVVLVFSRSERFTFRSRLDNSLRRLTWLVLRDWQFLSAISLGGVMAQVFALVPVFALPYLAQLLPGTPLSTAILWASVLVLAGALEQGISYLKSTLHSYISATSDTRFMSQACHRVLGLPMAWHHARGASQVLLRLLTSTTFLAQVKTLFVTIHLSGFIAITTLIATAFIHPVLLVPMILGGVALLLVGQLQIRRIKESCMAPDITTADLGQLINETVHAAEWLELSGLMHWARQRFATSFARSESAHLNFWNRHVSSSLAMTSTGVVMKVSALAWGAFLAHKGVIAPSQVGAYFLLLSLFSQGINGLVRLPTSLSQIMVSLTRIDDLFLTHQEAHGSIGSAITGPIQIRNVSFSYWPGGAAIFHDVSLEIAPGEFIGLVGPSGSGKSTLGHLIAGVRPASAGSICFGGLPLCEWAETELRRRIHLVPQAPELFAESVAFNLGLGDSYSEESMWAALQIVELVPVIERLGGLNGQIEIAGGNLSGGERQRLSLARALLSRPEVLILDEATSALEIPLENRILRSIRDLGTTCLCISHRRSGMNAVASRIVELRDGALYE